MHLIVDEICEETAPQNTRRKVTVHSRHYVREKETSLRWVSKLIVDGAPRLARAPHFFSAAGMHQKHPPESHADPQTHESKRRVLANLRTSRGLPGLLGLHLSPPFQFVRQWGRLGRSTVDSFPSLGGVGSTPGLQS